ncbi:MAG: alpha/beta fold hydrolase [Blastocatellia bacterium]
MKKTILTFCLTGSLLCSTVAFGARQHNAQNGKDAVRSASTLTIPNYVAAEPVQFKGDNLMLSGVLFLPKNKAGQKVPAIVMVPEFYSGRDSIKVSKGQHNTYFDLAAHFAQRGFAVLRYDRRCTGESECATATMAVASDDGVGAVHFLRGRKEIDATKIFSFGHGDGSFIAAGIAGNKEVAGVIATAPPGRNANKLLKEWAQMNLRDQKTPAEESAAYLTKLDGIIAQLASGGAKTSDFQVDPKDEWLNPLIKHPDYAYSWLLDDPLALYPIVAGAVLVVHGGKDRRVNAREGSFIRDALKTGEHKDYETVVLPDMDYYLKVNKGAPSLEADNDVARPLDPALLKLIDEWLAKRVK